MKVKSISWLGVGVPFRTPFATAAGTVRTRFSLLVWLHIDSEITGIGEAPLPVDEKEDGLIRLAGALKGASTSLLGRPVDELDLSSLTGSLRFALETAQLDALGKLNLVPVARLLGGELRPISTNAVIGSASPQQTAELAKQAEVEGFTTLKLKVGGRPIRQDESALEAVRSAIGAEIKLRLDANQAWTPKEARFNIQRLSPFQPEYIEEPLLGGDSSHLAQLRKDSPVSIAADESLSTREDALKIIEAGAADVLILKAARLGGLEPTKEVVDLATEAGLRVVLTSYLETGVGLAASLNLAAALLPSEVHGLATGALLEHDLLTTPLLPHRGVLSMPSQPGLGVTLDNSALERYKLNIQGMAGG